jgi:hypothetical protein
LHVAEEQRAACCCVNHAKARPACVRRSAFSFLMRDAGTAPGKTLRFDPQDAHEKVLIHGVFHRRGWTAFSRSKRPVPHPEDANRWLRLRGRAAYVVAWGELRKSFSSCASCVPGIHVLLQRPSRGRSTRRAGNRWVRSRLDALPCADADRNPFARRCVELRIDSTSTVFESREEAVNACRTIKPRLDRRRITHASAHHAPFHALRIFQVHEDIFMKRPWLTIRDNCRGTRLCDFDPRPHAACDFPPRTRGSRRRS